MPQKYEREIEELLKRLDRQDGKGTSWQRGRRRWLPFRGVKLVVPPLTPARVMLIGVGLVFLGYLLRHTWAGPAIFLGLVGLSLLIAGYVSAIASGRRRPERRWRGEVLHLPGDEGQFIGRLRSLWRRWWNSWRQGKNKHR